LEGLTSITDYEVRTQPEPLHKNYLQPFQDLQYSRVKVDVNKIRFLNQRDNLYSCNWGDVGGYNKNGNQHDELSSIAFADFNGDGYDDFIIHPQYSAGESSTFTHQASSADIDHDGDLDIFIFGCSDDGCLYGFFINEGNMNFTENENIISETWEFFTGLFTSEISDINNDGYFDIILTGHEFERFSPKFESSEYPVGVGRILWGSEFGLYSGEDMSYIPYVDDFGTNVDIDVVDINSDGTKELILTWTGGSIAAADMGGEPQYGQTNFYGGHYIQICQVDGKNLIDVSDQLIDDNLIGGKMDWCCEP